MESDPLRHVLSKLPNPKQVGGKGWRAACPAHDDRDPSLDITTGDDGRVLMICRSADCSIESIVHALGLEMKDLFVARRDHGAVLPFRPRSSSVGLTLEAYAAAKTLPLEFLKSLGLSDIRYVGRPAVRVPYRTATGDESCIRYRRALTGPQRFAWQKGSEPTLYGLERLASAHEAGYVVVVEGESDCHTLWNHGIPALGLPGAGGWNEERDAAWFDDIEQVFVVVEPDLGGKQVLRWLNRSAIADRASLVTMPSGLKDPSDLHRTGPESFSERFAEILASAIPWEPPAPPAGAAIAERIVALIRRFVVMTDDQVTAVALWVLHTHAFEAADMTPYLSITSAE